MRKSIRLPWMGCLAICTFLQAGIGVRAESDTPDGSTANDKPMTTLLSNRSMTVSNDGRYLVYATFDMTYGKQSGVAVTLRMYDRVKREQRTIDSWFYPTGGGYIRSAPNARWSDDGSLLAYFAEDPERETEHLVIWDRTLGRETGRSKVRAIPGSSPLAWLEGNRYLLFVANEQAVAAEDSNARTQKGNAGNERFELDMALSGIVRGTDGVTKAISPAAAAAWGQKTDSDIKSVVTQSPAPRRAVALFDTRTGETRILARAGYWFDMQYSAAGRMAVLIVQARLEQYTYSYFALPIDPARSVDAGAAAPRSDDPTPVDAGGKPLRQLAGDVACGIRSLGGRCETLSPSGRSLAYAPSGSDSKGTVADGKIYVLDIASSRKQALAQNAKVLPVDADGVRTSADMFREVKMQPMPPPIWMAGERSLLVLRLSAAHGKTSPRRFAFWTVPVDNSGVAREAVSDSSVAIEGFVPCVDSELPCVIGESRELVARVRRPRDGMVSYATIGIDGALRRTIVDIGPSRDEASNVSEGSGITGTATVMNTLLSESAGSLTLEVSSFLRPVELWEVNIADKQAGAHSLGLLNKQLKPITADDIRVVEWASVRGFDTASLLHLPVDRKPGQKLPLIVVAYPSIFVQWDRMYMGKSYGDRWFAPLIHRGGFAVLETYAADHGAREGKACDQMTQDTLTALDVALKTGAVDERKVGVLGHSGGGYFVNCLVTRTNRFRAAVSGSGMSDLISGYFGATNLGYPMFRAAPWEVTTNYIADSPVFHLAKVETPLLLYAGKLETTINAQQREMYWGLLDLKKPVAIMTYDDVHHSEMFNLPTFWSDLIGWFNFYF